MADTDGLQQMYANLALASVLTKQSALDQARRYTRHLQTVCALSPIWTLDRQGCSGIVELAPWLFRAQHAGPGFEHACKARTTLVAQVP